MKMSIKNRHEILFIYDVKDGNPNGDPMDSNKPRMDVATGVNIVSDVRLKRTIRDHLAEKGEELFVSGDPITSEKRASLLITDLTDETYNKKAVEEALKLHKREGASKLLLEKCIDLRLFGGTVPLTGLNMSITGPVQFRFGRSLHVVDPVFTQGTAAFVSQEGKEQRSFREEWTLNYSCIAFYGVINQNTARHTLMSDLDLNKMLDAIWNGTRDLITRSKMEQLPRLLLDVVYNEGANFHIGELDKGIKFQSEIMEEKVRGVSDFKLEISGLKEMITKYHSRIQEIRYKVDPRLKLVENGSPFDLENLLEGKMKQLTE